MDTPREGQDGQNVDPTSEELKRELSDADLQSRGLLFSAKYLFCRAIIENGYDPKKRIPIQEIEARLKKLFPQEMGDFSPSYAHGTFREAFNWAREKAFEVWKVAKVTGYLKKDRPDASDETLEAEARYRIEMRRILDELGTAAVQAARDLGITKL